MAPTVTLCLCSELGLGAVRFACLRCAIWSEFGAFNVPSVGTGWVRSLELLHCVWGFVVVLRCRWDDGHVARGGGGVMSNDLFVSVLSVHTGPV